jgi:hypothetical protein
MTPRKVSAEKMGDPQDYDTLFRKKGFPKFTQITQMGRERQVRGEKQ